MKRLYVLLCFVVACSGFVKGQDTIEAIDFKAYLAKMDSIMCDSIYRVDTLYYPWEEDMQMVELKWKTVWKRADCKYDSLDYKNSYSLMPSIFIFRNKEGVFIKTYSNYLNFNIDNKAFKALDFINTDSYKEKYIPIVKINKYEKDIYFDKSLDIYFDKGLIDKIGNIRLLPEYNEIVFFKADSSIRIKKRNSYYFIDYNSLIRINDYIFNSIQSISIEEKYSIVDNYRLNKDSHNNYHGKTIIDNRGNNVLKGSWQYIYEYNNIFFLKSTEEEYMIVDKKMNTILPLTEEKTIPIFQYKEGKYILINLISGQKSYKEYLDTLSSEIEIVPNFKYGVYDEHGVLRIPVESYYNIQAYYNYIFATGENGKWSIYNLNYEKIIEDVNYIKKEEDILNCRVLYTKDKSYILYDLDKHSVKYKILEGREKLYYHDLKADGTVVLHNKKTGTYIEIK